MIALIAAFDLAQVAAEDGFAVVDEAYGVAELFDLVHTVRGEEDGFALRLELEKSVLKQRCVDGIESAERLIHDNETGIVKQRGDELDFLLLVALELLGFLVEGIGDFHARRTRSRRRVYGRLRR